MTLLSIIQNISDEIGIQRPSAIVSSTDTTVRQLLALANRSGKVHAKTCTFENLTREGSFTTVATESQGLMTTIASDFDRFLSKTMYDRSNTWIIEGPVNAAEWQSRKSSQITGSIRSAFRIRQGSVIFYPVPSAGKSVYFEYLSNQWCESNAAVGQTAFAADTDVARIDENIIAMDIKWRFLKAKGLDYSEEFRDWNTYLNQTLGYDGGSDVLNAGSESYMAVGPAIPDGSWDVT